MSAEDLLAGTKLAMCMADIAVMMAATAHSLRENTGLSSAVSGSSIWRHGYLSAELADYEDVASFTAWVEVVTRDNVALSCYLELRFHADRWVAERSVDENLSEGPMSIFEYDSRTFESLPLLAAEIPALVHELTRDFAKSVEQRMSKNS